MFSWGWCILWKTGCKFTGKCRFFSQRATKGFTLHSQIDTHRWWWATFQPQKAWCTLTQVRLSHTGTAVGKAGGVSSQRTQWPWWTELGFEPPTHWLYNELLPPMPQSPDWRNKAINFYKFSRIKFLHFKMLVAKRAMKHVILMLIWFVYLVIIVVLSPSNEKVIKKTRGKATMYLAISARP